MLIRLTNPSRGSNFEPGQLIRVGDKEGANLVNEGIGEQVGESEVQKFDAPAPKGPRPPRGNAFMLPPRWIHSCGFVAKDEDELKIHAASCD